jgi:hypothetical protein
MTLPVPFTWPPPIPTAPAAAITTDDVANASTVSGATTTDALDDLQSQINQTPVQTSSATGNPYIDAPSSPDAWNDEFVDGSPDLAARGYVVWNHDAAVTVVRVGDVTGAPSSTLAPNQYRSTRFGSTLLCQFPQANRCFVLKPCTGSFMFATRVGVPMGNGSWGGTFLTTAVSPPYFTNSHNSGAGPGWTLCYIDGPPPSGSSQRYLGRTINAAQFVDINFTAGVNFTFTEDTFIVNHDEISPAQYGTFVNASSMQSRGTSVGGVNGSLIMATPLAHAGVGLNSGPGGGVFGGTGILAIDYIRRMPVNSWLGF